MKTLRRKILHIFDDPEFDKDLRKEFSANGFDCVSETAPEKALDDLSYKIGIILVSGKLLRREMPVFFRSFKNSLFNKIPAIAVIAEEEEFYKKSILDLGFNDYISGIKLIQTIRKQYPKSLIIAVSSLVDDRIGPTAIDKGADVFMNKPINTDLFLNKIMAWLR